jgi:hypothetical protein
MKRLGPRTHGEETIYRVVERNDKSPVCPATQNVRLLGVNSKPSHTTIVKECPHCEEHSGLPKTHFLFSEEGITDEIVEALKA